MNTLAFINDNAKQVINTFCDTQGLDNEEVTKSIEGILKTTHNKDDDGRVLQYSDIEFMFFINAKFEVYINSFEVYTSNGIDDYKSKILLLTHIENIHFFK